jgi:SnoaL-like domain
MDVLSTGRAFVRALTAGDFEAVRATLADGVRLRMLVPKGPEEVRGAGAAAQTFARWFGGGQVPDVEASAADRVVGRLSVSYRLRVLGDEGWRRIEQHLFAAVGEGGRMETIDLLCSGFRPLPEPAASVNRFDAGDLGCADGLADEFRRRIAEGGPARPGPDDGPRGPLGGGARRRATMSDKLIFNCAYGNEDPERATLPFVAASPTSTWRGEPRSSALRRWWRRSWPARARWRSRERGVLASPWRPQQGRAPGALGPLVLLVPGFTGSFGDAHGGVASAAVPMNA